MHHIPASSFQRLAQHGAVAAEQALAPAVDETDDGGAVQQLARHAGVGAGRVDHDGRARRYVRRRLYRTCRPIAVGIDGLVRVMVMVMVRVRVRVRVRVGVRAWG